MGYEPVPLGVLSLVIFVNAYGTTFLFSFIGFMVVDLGAAKNKNESGYVAGYVTSAFFVGRMVSSIFWGYMADKYGRRPVLLIALLSIAIGGVAFGASPTFEIALLVRFLAGLFNGIIAVSKAMVHELTTGEHKAMGMSAVTAMWSLGLILGPAISGWTSSIPSDSLPMESMNETLNVTTGHEAVFSSDTFLEKNPYLLPSLITSALGTIGFVFAFLLLPETLNRGKQGEYVVVASNKEEISTSTEKVTSDMADDFTSMKVGEDHASEKPQLFNFGFIMCLIVYSLISYAQIFIDDVIPLWSLASQDRGGLNFGSQDTGTLLALGGACMLFASVFVYPRVAKYLSPTSTMICCSIGSGIIAILEPIIVHWLENEANWSSEHKTTGTWIALVLLNGSRVAITMMAFNANFLLTNNTIPTELRGRGNGISMGLASFAKMCGPATGTMAFAWSIKTMSDGSLRQDPFDWHFVFLIDGVLFFAVAALVYLFMPRSANFPLEELEEISSETPSS
mmetsp:Transcript_17128/g.20746  ORF Transcript_17128/g.20746 Transcript_17128/m.20746 type:complete len:509 (+) Transcript_17128:2092-3618(+)